MKVSLPVANKSSSKKRVGKDEFATTDVSADLAWFLENMIALEPLSSTSRNNDFKEIHLRSSCLEISFMGETEFVVIFSAYNYVGLNCSLKA